uniref:Sterile alpha motif domain-containing protein 11 n=2 Tax=Bactrocera latifrons TaxID=174628 RepID=A0A0K8UFS3_BACLA
MISEQSLTLAFRGGFSLIDKQLRGVGANPITSSSTTRAVAYQYLDLAASSEISNVLNMESAASSTIKNCNTNSNIVNRNNCSNNINSKVMINQVPNALSVSAGGVANANSSYQKHCPQSESLQTNPQKQQTAQKKQLQNNSNNVKSERLSPGTNGDHQSSISRSRSTTPSSFRGPSPQQISSEALMPLTSLLRIQEVTSGHQTPCVTAASTDTANLGNTTTVFQTDFSSRNYSDIMRSLAAKYNDVNAINSISTRCNPFFDTTSPTSSIPIVNKNVNQKSGNRNVVGALSGPLTSKDASPQLIPRLSMSQGDVAVAAAAASFLSSLPFSQNVCLPMIDMSSTQALITLARAAKEAEVQTILRTFQQDSKQMNSNSILSHPNLGVALQQAAQYVSPALSLPVLQKQQQIAPSQQSSPLHKLISASTSSTISTSKRKSTAPSSTTTVPLDLSSQPPATKRFKVELNTASQSNESYGLNVSMGRVSSNEIKVSSSPISENKFVTDSTKNNARLSFSPELSTPCNTAILKCQAESVEIAQWTVDDVCAFVGDIDICADYVQHFRDQCIDGSGLPLLTEDHLLNSLGMKLGPALKLRSKLAKRLGGPCPCVACITRARQMLVLQAESMNDQPKTAITMSTECSPTEISTIRCEESIELPKLKDTIDSTKETFKNIQKGSQNQQLLGEGRETKRCSINDNNERTNNCSSLKVQICANIYKNEANNNHHNNDEVNVENFITGRNVNDKTSGYVLNTTFKQQSNDICLSNIKSSSNSNVALGSQIGNLSEEVLFLNFHVYKRQHFISF